MAFCKRERSCPGGCNSLASVFVVVSHVFITTAVLILHQTCCITPETITIVLEMYHNIGHASSGSLSLYLFVRLRAILLPTRNIDSRSWMLKSILYML